MISENKRIAKNTFFLYGRMLFLTIINLYTVRVTLNALGVEDYGIYNVIGSFVAFFSIITSTLTSATQRFLSFHLGTKNYDAYSKTFSLLLISFVVIAIAIIVIAECFGLVAFHGFLNIPDERLSAAKWVYQTSIVTFIIYLITIPFTSSIVSNEKMSAFAYISIIDGIARLGLVYILLIVNSDRLIVYGFLTMVEAILICLSYIVYCKINFTYCRISWIWDKGMFKELTSYTGWNLIGALSGTLASQGQSILLNMFFGPIINASKGIADKIHNVIYSLSSNFYMAVSPQIVKSYASNDMERMRDLAVRSSKLSFMLLYFVSFPLICSMESILILWLGPEGKTEDMIGFARLVLIQGLIGCLESPVTQMIRATGKIRTYQIKVGVFTLLYIPLAWIALKLNGSPLLTMWVLIWLYSFVQCIRVYQAKIQVGLDVIAYLKSVISPIIIISIISALLFCVLYKVSCHSAFITAALQCSLGTFISGLLIWAIGLNRNERNFVKNVIINRLK